MPRKAKAKTTKKTTKKTKQTGGSTPAPVEATPAPAPETVKQSGGRAPNPWLVHVKQVKAANPDLKFKDVLIKAKESYTKVSKKE